ncbi:MAG: peptidylprolyl isomerase [Polyangiaceae bacterium]|nr:peptidylprolyl isomerase [Polyangiaceae bacterium]
MGLRSFVARALFALVLAAPAVAEAVTIEKVVAVVGEKAILQTDVRKRARLALSRVYAMPDTPQRTAAVSSVTKVVLDRMIEEELEANAAARQSVTVSSEEVDGAMRKLATRAGTTVAKFVTAATQETGSTEQEFRQELRRQLLEGKLVARLIEERFTATEADMKAMFDKVVAAERGMRLYHPAWIVLRLEPDAPPEVVAARSKLAAEIVARVRQGADFGALARQYSDDKTAQNGGDLGIRAPAGSEAALSGRYGILSPKLEDATVSLEPGQVSEPLVYEGSIVVLALAERQPSRYTTLEAARDEMVERLRGEQFQKAKEKWLKDLRRRTHVIVR